MAEPCPRSGGSCGLRGGHRGRHAGGRIGLRRLRQPLVGADGAWSAAAIASLAAEAVFSAVVALSALLMREDPWRVVKMPAAFLLGDDAVEPAGFHLGDVAGGVAAHVVAALLVAAALALLVPRLSLSPLAAGLLTGGLLYLFGFWILPRLFPVRLGAFDLPPLQLALQAFAHLVYALVLAYVFARLAAAR